MNNIIETMDLTKKYGEKRALDNVSIHVAQGDIYGLVGRNGAGKTTLMKIICGLATQSSGDFSIFGRKGSKIGEIASRRGMLIESPGYYGEYDAKMNLRIKCRLAGISDKEEPDRLLELVGLSGVGKKKVKNYSLGMKQRLGITMALVGNPDIVVLDEPINGLDPQGIVEVRDLITRQNREHGTTFIISSHILDELSKTATRYGIINEGRLIEECSVDELNSKCESKIELVVDSASAAVAVLEKIGFSQIKVMDEQDSEGHDRIFIYEQFDRTGDITLALASEGITTYEIVKQTGSVESYYLKLVGKEQE
ncbi:MAG: ATP-binding cassette domain-containing protein [Lachnospiraceae bacterium]|nr:ATP-binding cassette domain-containing protein [Lachnospiraceae bacterium]